MDGIRTQRTPTTNHFQLCHRKKNRKSTIPESFFQIDTHTHTEKERKKIYKKSRQRKTGGWPLLLLLPVTAWLTLGCFWEVNSLYSGVVVVVVAVASSSSSSFYFILQSHQSPNASSRWL
jgi:hypothetical protein